MTADKQIPKTFLWAGLLLLLLAAFALVIVVTVKRARAVDAAHRAVLPDGSTIEFLGTSAGGSNFTTETKLQAIARLLLPSRFQGWIPSAITGNCSSGTNSITVYLRVLNPTLFPGGPNPWDAYVVEDADGFRFPREGGYCTFGSTPGSKMFGLIVRSFPRRQPEFLFHLLDTNGEPIATLHVPNPVPGAFPEWKPLPLPQTQINGPVILTLRSVQEAGDKKWRYVDPQWTLTSTNPAWVHASAHGVTLLDATGNTGQFLSRKEPAWKVQTFVYRDRPQDFSPTEQMVLTNLALPAPGNFFAVDQSADCDGVKVKLLLLAGPGSLTISNGVRSMLPPSAGPVGSHSSSSGSFGKSDTWGGTTPFMLLETRNIQDGDEPQLHVRDENGREIKFEMPGYDYSGPNARLYKPTFNPSQSVTNITVQVIINRPLAFEFMVNPVDLQPQKR